jgi:hypothetical protein
MDGASIKGFSVRDKFLENVIIKIKKLSFWTKLHKKYQNLDS